MNNTSNKSSNNSSVRMKFQGARAVRVIVIINVIVFLIEIFYLYGTTATSSSQQELDQKINGALQLFGLMPMGYGFYPWQLLTSMFLHGGLFHILFNMITLWFIGQPLEMTLGTKRFTAFYLLSGIITSLLTSSLYGLLNYLGAGDFTMVTIGASGAIFAVFIGTAYFYPNSTVYVYFLIPVKIKWMVLIFIGFNVIMALTDSNISVSSHLFGALVGFLYLALAYPLYPKLDAAFYPIRRLFGSKKPKAESHQISPRYHAPYAQNAQSSNEPPRQRISEAELVDLLLAKIDRWGYESLSPKEKQFLDYYSSKL